FVFKIMLRRILKYSSIGVGVGVAGGCAAVLHANEWRVSNLGIVRLGRAAVTVGSIVVDYKLNLHGATDDNEETVKKWSEVHNRSAHRLLNLCCKNGGVFIKVGQHIATLEFLVPKEYCNVLKVLHSKAPTSTYEEIMNVMKKDLKQNPDDIFVEFDKEPIGTASLAQVYKAKLKTGEVVAVKVQHPHVRSHSLVDMTTMDMLVKTVAKIFPEFSFLWLAEQMKLNLPLELDFIHEAHNAERVQRMFSCFPWLKIPEIHWQYCTERVLTMEFLEGGEVTDKSYMERNGINVREISNLIGQLYSRMIFNEGYVHCDPHPGNILIRNGSNGVEVVLLDHGLYTTLPENFRHQYSQLWLAIINGDKDAIKKWGQELGTGDLYPLLACILAKKPWNTVSAGLANADTSNSKKEDEELRQYAREYFPQIAKILSLVSREMLLVLKTNDLLRGIETSLGTKGEKRAFITMSKCCIEAVYETQLKHCHTYLQSLSLNIQRHWTHMKLNIFQLYLWLMSSLFSAYA
ncbi:putative aarF domain-containing protein kinase 1-like protein, partial [Leptotrombidium deliense]